MAFEADPQLAWLASGDPISVDRHAELISLGICLVARQQQGRPCGFIASERFGTDLHIWELSVEANQQRRGIGRSLLLELCRQAQVAGLERLTLTTFRDLPWNGPFYQSFGFAELQVSALDARLARLLANEVRRGLPSGRRCAMTKPV
jgi:ribosomal protein S18 acetylase RimI-like enzyme